MSNLSREFLELLRQKTLIIGIGNALKGDDSVGIVLLDRLKCKVDAEFLDCGIAPENFLEKIAVAFPETLIIIDAVDLGEAPGTMRIIKAVDIEEGGISTHSLSPRIFIEYIETRLKGTSTFILAIQPGNCNLGKGLSREVGEAIDNFLNSL